MKRYSEGGFGTEGTHSLYDVEMAWRSRQRNNSVFCRKESYADNNYSYPLHWHGLLEIIYVLEGAFQVEVNGTRYFLEPGDMVFINVRKMHDIASAGEGAHSFINMQFEPRIFHSAQRAEYFSVMPFIFVAPPHHIHFTARELADSPIPQAITECYREETEQRAGREIAMHMHLLDIFVWLLRFWYGEGVVKDEPTVLRYLDAIMPALDYVAAHYTQSISPTEMAKLCNLSYTHFCRRFRDITGQTMTSYVNLKRIDEARHLLFTTDCSISEIAETVGISDVNYFIRRFKAAVGLSPYRFKKICCNRYGRGGENLALRREETTR